MKGRLILILTTFIMATLVLSACGNGDKETKGKDSSEKSEVDNKEVSADKKRGRNRS
ncbi:hypothetical protein JFL43_12820 [Viridibacillus sp. YIM B01967]|uniref:Lipoprotein n=1 Tax=Viridibacillus soli TaxID=2798301 RepID=A0ABS1H8H3_9BACL|nr:hypothetical protein [Viridibacillus soli]MBK3495720.1 hypothetical protein [Viridibacillus soli]